MSLAPARSASLPPDDFALLPLGPDPDAAPLPPPHRWRTDLPRRAPGGPRRISDPRLEAEVARSWSARRDYEERGYHFPDHPRPRVPRLLRALFPLEAAQDDALAAAPAPSLAPAPSPEAPAPPARPGPRRRRPPDPSSRPPARSPPSPGARTPAPGPFAPATRDAPPLELRPPIP